MINATKSILRTCVVLCAVAISAARAQDADQPAQGRKPGTQKKAVAGAQPDAETKTGKKKPAETKDAGRQPDEKQAEGIKRLDGPTMIRRLQARTDIKVEKTPLKDVLAELSKKHDVVIQFDEPALKKAGLTRNVPVTASIRNFTLNAALNHILKDLKLHHVHQEGVIVVTSAEPAAEADLGEGGKAHAARRAAEGQMRAAMAQRAAAARAQPGMNAALGVEANPDPEAVAAAIATLEKQFTRQFRAAMRTELNFVQSVCDPTEEQMAELRENLEKYRTDVIKKYSEVQKRLARQRQQAGNNPYPEVHKLVRQTIERSVKNWSPEQAARFEAEVEQRAADRKRAAVRNLVARLDHDLTLSAEQREKISESLLSNWNANWVQQFEIFLQQGNQFLPKLPPPLITPHLNPTQKTIWMRNQENQGNQNVIFRGGILGGGFLGMLGADDAAADEDDADEPAQDKADEPKAEP